MLVLEEAVQTVFEGQAKDVSAWVSVDHTPGYERTVFTRALDFYNSLDFLLQGDTLERISAPRISARCDRRAALG